MSSSGTVSLEEIWAMLNHCAPGWDCKEREHNFAITYNGKTFPRLPRGPHGKRGGNVRIQIGHIKQMVRFLGIEECAAKYIELLR